MNKPNFRNKVVKSNRKANTKYLEIDNEISSHSTEHYNNKNCSILISDVML